MSVPTAGENGQPRARSIILSFCQQELAGEGMLYIVPGMSTCTIGIAAYIHVLLYLYNILAFLFLWALKQ